MIYIYNNNGVIATQRDVAPQSQYIALERMIPQPVKQGYEAVLKADFNTNRVWFDMVSLPLTLEEVRDQVINSIKAYDLSQQVNSFNLGESMMWLDKSTRVGLVNSINIELSAGREITNLWFGGVQYSLAIPLALTMLNQLELYALDCYNITQQHLSAVLALQTVEEIEAYDYTLNYPEKLTFNI